ncbi:hypothetical protein [Paenibacillus sp. Marseille-Q4541]|uniref:hypothetical protein n=1 Tax=Paenibacillus sp. Marseille-Q4541 TaxID=2831522 RepID=UPI001BAB382D|nr:hypothetical protein [Paenibacillus sp. Marseille-Q4541]
MIVNCAFCDNEINRSPSDIKRCKNSFCNKECKDKFQSTLKGEDSPHYKQATVECGHCNKSIRVPQYKLKDLKQGKRKNLFCDRHCLAEWQKIEFSKQPILKTCKTCETKYQTKRENQEYCSNICFNKSKIANVDLECDYCTTLLTKKPAQVRDNNFCSVECRSKWNSETKNKQINKKCTICNENYIVQNNRRKSKCCSVKCLNIWKSKIYPNTPEGKLLYINNGIRSTLNAKHKDTKPERMVRDYLKSNHIPYEPQKLMYDKFIVDFYLPSHDTVIEVLGDYWHANPIKYGNEEDGLIPLTPKQERQRNKDKARFAYLKTVGHNIVGIWENDIYIDTSLAIKEQIDLFE